MGLRLTGTHLGKLFEWDTFEDYFVARNADGNHVTDAPRKFGPDGFGNYQGA